VLAAIKKLHLWVRWSLCLVFKRLQYVIVKPIKIIYNQLFSVAFVPSEWKKAIITPVHKKGPTTIVLTKAYFYYLCYI